MKDNKYMVFTLCSTYNQSIYIKETLDGFCMQQTDFPFVCAVVDDASTDGEQEVIKNYLHEHFDLEDKKIVRQEETDGYFLTFARHNTNLNCYFAVLYLKYNHYSIKKSKDPYLAQWRDRAKYIAFCEGDDFWIDPLKLQKQFDFMESHPDHSLCFCAHKELYSSGETKQIYQYNDNKDTCPMQDIIMGGGGFMATNSMFYSNSKYIPYTKWAVNCPVGDSPLMLTLANNGLVGYLSDIMCVYRRDSLGSWSNRISSSLGKKYRHFCAIRRMWKQFDRYSNYRYHRFIKMKMRNNTIVFLKEIVKRIFLVADNYVILVVCKV